MEHIKFFSVCMLICVLPSLAFSQSDEKEFTEESFKMHILNFNHTRKKGVSEKEFLLGKNRFQNALDEIRKNSFHITTHDYWQLTLAQISLKEPSKNIRYTLYKAYELDPDLICFILQFQEQEAPEGFQRIHKIIPELKNIVDTCQPIKNEDSMCSVNYSKKNNVNYQLVALFQRINVTDQKYRVNGKEYKKHKAQQDEIDKQNQQIIDSLYQIHKKYIGRTLVGKEYEHTMWLVIQHSNIEMMKKYLPIVHEAVRNNEIKTGPLKMLIDRIYHIEHGYQIFGSQHGVEIADEEIRNRVIAEYDFKNL